MTRQTHGQTQKESPWVSPSWHFELLLRGVSSWFLLANHFYLSGSQSMFGVSQDPPMWVHTSLSQGGFHGKGLWVEYPLASLPFGLQGAFLHMCGQGSLLTSRRRNMGSGQGPASPLNCPATLVFSFLSTGNESPVTLPCREHLPPASFRGCQPQKKKKKNSSFIFWVLYSIFPALPCYLARRKSGGSSPGLLSVPPSPENRLCPESQTCQGLKVWRWLWQEQDAERRAVSRKGISFRDQEMRKNKYRLSENKWYLWETGIVREKSEEKRHHHKDV